jgi:hypothetical protein
MMQPRGTRRITNLERFNNLIRRPIKKQLQWHTQ